MIPSSPPAKFVLAPPLIAHHPAPELLRPVVPSLRQLPCERHRMLRHRQRPAASYLYARMLVAPVPREKPLLRLVQSPGKQRPDFFGSRQRPRHPFRIPPASPPAPPSPARRNRPAVNRISSGAACKRCAAILFPLPITSLAACTSAAPPCASSAPRHARSPPARARCPSAPAGLFQATSTFCELEKRTF